MNVNNFKLVLICIVNELFWYSNDVYFQTHVKNLCFKICIYRKPWPCGDDTAIRDQHWYSCERLTCLCKCVFRVTNIDIIAANNIFCCEEEEWVPHPPLKILFNHSTNPFRSTVRSSVVYVEWVLLRVAM